MCHPICKIFSKFNFDFQGDIIILIDPPFFNKFLK